MESVAEDSIQALLTWSEQNAGRLDPNVAIHLSRHAGYSFTAKTDLPSGTIVAESSYQMSLSYLNAIDAVDTLFERHGSPRFADGLRNSSKISPKILGNVFLMQQYLIGERSFWWPYIRILPQPNETDRFGLPVFWPPGDQIFFRGTNIERGIQVKTDLWNQEWWLGGGELALHGFEECLGPDCISHKAHDTTQYTRDLYRWAAAVFESRSFRPSETIHLSEDVEASELRKHISEDNFAVLYPLIDMGNHNGLDRLEWLKPAGLAAGADSEPDFATRNLDQIGTPSFRLRTLKHITPGSEIYNFYGPKDNAELLLGYGFMLGRAFDRLNLKVTAPAELLSLRRQSNCHIKPANADEEFLFKIGLVYHIDNPTRLPIQPARIPNTVVQTFWDIASLPSGLICTLSCLVASHRERSFLTSHPEFCIEKSEHFSDHFNDYFMGRNAIAALNMLRVKVENDLQRLLAEHLESNNTRTIVKEASKAPKSTKHQIALEYRAGQVDILSQAFEVVSSIIDSACKNASFCQSNGTFHTHPLYQTAGISCKSLSDVNILSLDTAYAWVELQYPDIHGWLVKEISRGQDDEPLPLNWAKLIPDWDQTYWTVWVFLILFLAEKEGQLPHPKLNRWVLQMSTHWREMVTDDPLTKKYYADQDELDIFMPLLEGIADRMPEVYSSPDRSEKIRDLGFFASFLAQEETVRMHYAMLNELGKRKKLLQRVLVI